MLTAFTNRKKLFNRPHINNLHSDSCLVSLISGIERRKTLHFSAESACSFKDFLGNILKMQIFDNDLLVAVLFGALLQQKNGWHTRCF